MKVSFLLSVVAFIFSVSSWIITKCSALGGCLKLNAGVMVSGEVSEA